MVGRTLMDMFMDKLAQKLTAQEMIRANMAADAVEMSKLKDRAREYSECLDQIQTLVEAGVSKLEAAKVDSSEIDRLVEAAISKIEEVKAGDELKSAEILEALEELKKQLNEKLEAYSESTHKECVKVYRNVQAVVVEENNKQTESIKEILNQSVGEVKGYGGKLKAILIISIISMVLSLGGIVVQLLNILGILYF